MNIYTCSSASSRPLKAPDAPDTCETVAVTSLWWGYGPLTLRDRG